MNIPTADLVCLFEPGETIWTASSHQFELQELSKMALDAGFEVVEEWVDGEWPFV